MNTERIDANGITVWTPDSGNDVGTISVLVWTEEALHEGTPAVEAVLSDLEVRALIAELQQALGNAANAVHYWKAQGAL